MKYRSGCYSQALSKIHKPCQNRMQGELGEIGTKLLWNGLSFFIIQKTVSTNVKFVELIFRMIFERPRYYFQTWSFQILFPAKNDRQLFFFMMFCYLVTLESGLSWITNVSRQPNLENKVVYFFSKFERKRPGHSLISSNLMNG